MFRIDESDADIKWRDVPGFPKTGYRRAQVYLRQRGMPFAKLSLDLDDEGYPLEPFPDVTHESIVASSTRLRGSGETMTFPLVSIVLSTAGMRPDLLRRCVESLETLSYPKFEIIIVDNRSKSQYDSGAEIWTSSSNQGSTHSVRTVREPRPGLSFARNTGVAAARGEIVAFTDDDVEVDANWLSALLMPLSHPRTSCASRASSSHLKWKLKRKSCSKSFAAVSIGDSSRAHGSFPVVNQRRATSSSSPPSSLPRLDHQNLQHHSRCTQPLAIAGWVPTWRCVENFLYAFPSTSHSA